MKKIQSIFKSEFSHLGALKFQKISKTTFLIKRSKLDFFSGFMFERIARICDENDCSFIVISSDGKPAVEVLMH